jgi:S-adenosylmethionine:tRNA ribosyltransferase-isomerase
MLLVDAERAVVGDDLVAHLPRHLRPGDLLVLNDAATLPASLRVAAEGAPDLELRLAVRLDDRSYRGVLFGPGDFRMRTEDRPPPPARLPGGSLWLRDAPHVRLAARPHEHPRLLDLRFDLAGPAAIAAIYAHGTPIQYAHVPEPLPLWAVQTPLASRPWAVEAPSASFRIDFALRQALAGAGVRLATLTHGAGLSSTGDAALDALFPLPEPYEIPAQTAAAIAETRRRGGRVIAGGTTVVRALESAAEGHAVRSGAGVATTRIGPATRLQIVDAVLSGMHEAGTSHFELLRAFAPRALLERGWQLAEARGYLGHELGDQSLVVRAA